MHAVLHADTGALLEDVVDSTAIDGSEAVMNDSALNLLAGGSLEHYGDRHNLLFRVSETPTPAEDYIIETTDTDGSVRAQKVEASGSNQGIILDLSPNFADGILAGKHVAATFRVKADVADSLEIGFVEDSTYAGTTPDITANTWTTVTVTKDIDTETDTVQAYVYANQECDFIVARAQMNLGEKAFGFSIGPYEDAARILMDTTQDNLLYNGGFERWTLLPGPPDGWFAVGDPEFTAPGGETNPAGSGNKLCKMTLQANEGIGQYLGLVTDSTCGEGCVNENILVGLIRESKVCASVDMMFDTTDTGEITLVLGDFDNTTADEEEFAVTPLVGEMRRFTVYKEIRSVAKQVYLKVVNKEGGTRYLSIDNAMLHVGEFPLKFKPSVGWREMRWDFSDATAVEGEQMDADGIPGGQYPMPEEATAYLMLKAAVRCLTAPAAGGNDTKYQLCVDGTSVNGISVSIVAEQYSGDNHITDYNDMGDQCKQFLTAPECTQFNGGDPEAAGVIFSVWGYYYAS
jgi:hypothetical protein